ncbi:DUF421 domain-containing protein [Methanosarcina sp.]|uniref:DUF421 domain-containing protein n=1 Tax=Methanosarcina sp. TaxID=2213 RepID=UPI002988E063|nr:YetF domain-containing protein [Methanosarcina sp.]MDW5550526.1 DUF421 domain-containing protein [Methanosarcina sp.]MDW5554230.1 DUF421 domain-containing protein [Methanosarcina sp.]MDW5559590.1 DUF421 domain-containing protein [Methanosarcina sp.]
MAEPSIEAFEIKRILIADAPWLFILEVIVRTVFMFVFALIIMRLLGRRAVDQLTPFDLLIIIALGSSMGDPMFYPDVAILWSACAIATVTVLYRVQTALVNKFPKYEDFTQGSPAKIISNGILNSKVIGKHTPTQDEIFLLLRNQSIRSLGEIETAYLERNGSVSVFKLPADKRNPGLPTLSQDMIWELNPHKAYEKVEDPGFYSCYKTGETIWLEKGSEFPGCEGNIWISSEQA